MNKDIQLLDGWIQSLHLQEEDSPTLKDIHVDELIGKKNSKTMFLRSIELFYNLIHFNFSYDFSANYIPSLVFRLEYSDQISLTVKEDILEEVNIAPPNIYLCPKINFLMIKESEEYKKPLNLDVFKCLQDDCTIYYRCFRTIEDIQNDWEYARFIYIHKWDKILSPPGFGINIKGL